MQIMTHKYNAVWAKRLHYATGVVAAINLFVFIAGSLYLGGDALNGYHNSSGYFVCAHGSCTEVSEAIWTYSYWHAWSATALILLVFFELGVFYCTGLVTFEPKRRSP
jgi:hypothetical protein